MKHLQRILSIFLVLISITALFSGFGNVSGIQPYTELTGKTDNLYEQPKASGQNDKLIALTFDDGPGRDTKRLLDALRKRGAHCTFFVVGQYAKIYSSTIKQCYEDGHQIASHSYTHPYLTSLSDSEIRSEMQKTNDAVNSAVGCKLSLMVRPPYGAYNDRVLSVLGVPAFYWSDDSGDWWSGATADSVYQNTIRTAGDGDILLLHDSHSWSVDAAIRIVDKLMSEGYEFVTLSELFRRRGVSLQPGHIYFYLRANGTNLPAISKPKITMTPTPDGMEISMTSDSGTKIYYTTDGSVPNAASKVYTKPFLLTQAVTLTAVAGYDMNGSRSDRIVAEVPKLRAAKAPVIDITDGTVTVLANDTVYYTTDGTEPSLDSSVYTESFSVEPGTVVRAFAYSGEPETVKSETVMLYYSENGNLFDDILPELWYTSAVDTAVTEGWMVGTAKHHFAPNLTVSRAQLVTVLRGICGGTAENEDSCFPDIPEGQWYTAAVNWAQENGIVAGYPDGSFHPNDAVTREQTAVILRKFASYCDYDTDDAADLGTFTDGGKTSDYAKEAMQWAVAKGLFSGNEAGKLMPKQSMTRAQLACVIAKYQECENGWSKAHLTDEELLTLADEVLELLNNEDFGALETYLHPQLGLTFTPYSTVGEEDRRILPEELSEAASSDALCVWGSYDGSGEDISLSFEDYWNRFVWNTDYANADTVSLNKFAVSGNAIENVREAYPDCLFIEYAINSTLGYDDGTDWSTLKLVFVRYEKQWYLTGLIHGEWTT